MHHTQDMWNLLDQLSSFLSYHNVPSSNWCCLSIPSQIESNRIGSKSTRWLKLKSHLTPPQPIPSHLTIPPNRSKRRKEKEKGKERKGEKRRREGGATGVERNGTERKRVKEEGKEALIVIALSLSLARVLVYSIQYHQFNSINPNGCY